MEENNQKESEPNHEIPKSDSVPPKSSSDSVAQNLNVQRRRKDRLLVKCMRVQITTEQPLRSPYLILQIGNQRYRTTASMNPDGRWNETFEFRISFHAELFAILQLDLYETRFLIPDYHVGRVEIKLSLLRDVPSQFHSWFELWHKKHSYSRLSEVSRRSILSGNVGAIELLIEHGLNSDSADASRSMDRSSSSTTVNELSGKSTGRTLERPAGLISERQVTPVHHSRMPSDNRTLTATEAKHLSESIEYFYKEEAEEEERASTPEFAQTLNMTFLERIGGLVLSKETNTVLKSIQSLLVEFGQGLEIANGSLLSGILTLEKFYMNWETPRTGDVVRELSLIEIPRYFYKFAMAAYGWKGLNFFGKGSGIITDSVKKDSDRKCLLQFLSLPSENLLDCELARMEVFRPSYFIAIDMHTEALILTIRGTMSTTDTLTDLVCEYTKFQDGFVHAGIKTAAQWFIDNLLDKIKGFLSEHQLSRLTLVGHSLGGATCSVLTMMLVQRQNELLQRNGEPIEIYCYAFAAPPAVSLNLAKRHEPYISTFVAEDDAVCRLSYGHMMDLKSMLISAIELENSRPTILGNMWASIWAAEIADPAESIMDGLSTCRDVLRQAPNVSYENLKLYLPGKIYFMYYEDRSTKPFASLLPQISSDAAKTATDSSESDSEKMASSSTVTGPLAIKRKPLKRVVMEKSRAECFDEIIVKRTMLLEHIPNAYDKAFDRAFETLMLDLK